MINLNKYEETTYGKLEVGDVFSFVDNDISGPTIQMKIGSGNRVYLRCLTGSFQQVGLEGSVVDFLQGDGNQPVLLYGKAADIIQVKKIPDTPDVELIDHFVRHFIEAYENDATPQELWDLVHQRDALITGEVVP